MADLRALPTIYEPSDAVSFPTGFAFALHRDVRVFCIDQCGVERELETGRDFTVDGGGEGRSDCKAREGKVCLSCAKPEHIILIEHYPDAVALDPSVKPLTRKEAIAAIERMQARMAAMEHRLSLAARVPLHHPGPGTLTESTDDGVIRDDGLWSEDCATVDDGVWHVEISACPIADDGDWMPCGTVVDDGAWPVVPGFADDGFLDLATCEADDGEWGECIPDSVRDDGFWDMGTYEYLPVLSRALVHDDGMPDLAAPMYRHKRTTKTKDDGDVSMFYGSRALRMEVHHGHC